MCNKISNFIKEMEKKSKNKRRVRLLGLKKFQETDRAKKARQAAKNKNGGKLKKSLLNVENEKKLRKNTPVNIKPFHHTDDKNKFTKQVVKKERVEKTPPRRILCIIIPNGFSVVTDKTRKKKIYKRGVKHEVLSVEERDVSIMAHNENACKYLLVKALIPEQIISIGKNYCSVALRSQTDELAVMEALNGYNLTMQTYRKVKQQMWVLSPT